MKYIFALPVALYFLFNLCVDDSHSTEQYKCCTRKDWEATIYMDHVEQTFDLGLLIWMNATYRLAYSRSLNKYHSILKVVERYHPILPIFTDFVISLVDYNKGIEYDMASPDGTNCTKYSTTTTQLGKLCIPGNATLVSRGSLADGKGTLQSTYRFGAVDTANYSYTATATVVETGIQGVCDPVHVTIYYPDYLGLSTTLEDYDIFDIGPINSTDIFKVPKKCLQ